MRTAGSLGYEPVLERALIEIIHVRTAGSLGYEPVKINQYGISEIEQMIWEVFFFVFKTLQ